MVITNVNLVNFRNYPEETVSFSPGLNVIYGANGAGKTNILESIYLAALAKSHRSERERELISFTADWARATVSLEKRYRDVSIEIFLDKQGKKEFSVNKIPVKKVGELIGNLNIVFFSPQEIKIVRDNPAERRRFIDINLCQQKRQYFYSLQRYNRILAQRNKTLKTAFGKTSVYDILPVWNASLAKEGAYIIKERYGFIGKLLVHARAAHAVLSGGKEELSLVYQSLIGESDLPQMEAQFLDLLTASVQRDIDLGFTGVGAQRDDIDIFVNKKLAKSYASQGQQRTAALAMKLAEIPLFEAETGEKPVIILDDVLSELDPARQKTLLSYLQSCQTLLTCNEFALDPALVEKWLYIENGRVC